jgi:membrane protease YdiL (CAAX protease family)
VNDDPRNQETEAGASPEAPADRPPDWRAPAPPGYGPPPGWWQTPDGRWQPPPWQPSAQPPWPAQPPPRPYGTGPAAAPPTPGDGQTFGVTRGLRPGQVPWHWRDVLFAVLIAATPLAILTVLGTISSGRSAAAPQTPTAGFAFAAIVSTVLVDGWLVFWAWSFSLRKYRLSLASFGFRGYEEGSYWAVAAAVILGGVFATSILGSASDYAYRRIVGPVPKENVVTVFPHTSAGLVLFIVLAVLVAPLLEETFFRGFVNQGLARSWGPLLGAVTSALVFALWHQQLSVLITIFGLGLLLSAAFYWTKSIYTNIAFHAVFNALGILAWWFVRTRG